DSTGEDTQSEQETQDRQKENDSETDDDIADIDGEKDQISAAASADTPPPDAKPIKFDLPYKPRNAPSNEFEALLHTHDYHAYTSKFDEVIDADKLATHDEIVRLPLLLDQKLTNLHSITSKLANRLQRLLFAKQATIFEYGLEEGIIDSKHLSKV